jgi:hypothetical protein
MTVSEVSFPARVTPAQTQYTVSFPVQGDKPCVVKFKNKAEAVFYDAAYNAGVMQVIYSEYRVWDEYDGDCAVFVWAPGSPRFSTMGMDVRSDPDCFAHSWDRWADWADFMPFFPVGTKVACAVSAAEGVIGGWRCWSGAGWADCTAPYNSEFPYNS